jgi:hypothetical protein
MATDTIQLHEVTTGVGLPAVGLNRLRAQRLNLFPGRALGEDEFDRLQAWGDGRIAALEGALPRPGILSGLDCRLGQQDGEPVLWLAPGSGLGVGRELLSLTAPLTKGWAGLRDEYKARPGSSSAPLDGLYLVVLDAVFFHLDVGANDAACRRTEPDRLRDARIARGLRLSLAAVDAALWTRAEVRDRPPTAANRLLGALLAEPERMPAYSGVSVALIGVRDNALLWLDAAAGAFGAVASPIAERLRAHLDSAILRTLRDGLRDGLTPLAAMQRFTPAWLPAAAELPAFLLNNPAGVNPLPRLDWFPVDAALELQVLPASSVPMVLGASLRRAATPFDRLAGDRYRIGIVVSDAVYRDDLLALPRLDAELPDLLRRTGILARNAAVDAQIAWDRLAAGFDTAANPDVAVPPRPVPAEAPDDVLKALGAHDWRAKQANATLEAPYSEGWPAPANDLPVERVAPADPPDGLLARAAAEQALQKRLDEMLADIAALLEMLEEEKKQQRSLVDSLTVDLAQLAGGVAGDGSGLKVARVARSLLATPKAVDD